jgi:hypothetical protein
MEINAATPRNAPSRLARRAAKPGERTAAADAFA